MMSRITIDLKKRAKEHIHDDISRSPVVVYQDGPSSYQLSRIQFRDPCDSGWKQNSGGSGTVADTDMTFFSSGSHRC